MIKFLKRNKTFSICIFMTFIVFIFGIFFNALLDSTIKKEIALNINNMISNFNKNALEKTSLIKNIFNDFSFITVIWIFGISIIGIIINLFLYLFKVFMFSFELVALLTNLHIDKLFFILLYMLPSFFKIILYFIVIYYSINYSLVLIRLLFLKKNFNIKIITQRYIKVLILCLLCSLIISLVNDLLISKLLLFLLR